MTAIARLSMYPQPETSPLDRGVDGYDITAIDCYALAETDLGAYGVLVVQSTIDQEFLARHRDVVRAYLDGGGVLIFGGHLHRDWLPGSSPFVPVTPPGLAAYQVAEVAQHPIFAGVDAADLTFRRGVAGFFARGHHEPPGGAQVLARLAGGQPTTYVDQVSTNGTILLQATSDLIGYGDGLDTSAARLTRQVLDWAVQVSGNGRATPTPRAERGESAAPARFAAADPQAGRGAGIAAVYGGSAFHHRALTTPKYAQHLTGGLLYLPELARTDLTGYEALIIPERMHQGLVQEAAPRVLELLEAGGTVVAFSGGEPLPQFLPGVRWQHRPTNYWWWREPGASLGLYSPTPGHRFFHHLGIRDCTWHYHGALDAPDGAEVLVALPTGEALLYVDDTSTNGRLVVSTLDPLSHFGGYFMPATERFLDGFLPWLTEAASRIRS